MNQTLNIIIRNNTGDTLTDGYLLHWWKDGATTFEEAHPFVFALGAPSPAQPRLAVTISSGVGGDDRWLLLFKHNGTLMAMGSTKVNVHAQNEKPFGVIFDFLPNGVVSFIKTTTGEKMSGGSWDRAERVL
jgi:hypothetical protein